MPCTKPNDLRLVLIKLQAITGHPIANAFKAAGEAFNCFLARGRWYTDIQLCIVCIRVTSETELRHNVMLPPLGKLRYSRWFSGWLLRQEIFYLFQYLDNHLHYSCNKNVFSHVTRHEHFINDIIIDVYQQLLVKRLL